MTNAYHPERGGAAFYIILGIMLLAALSWAVTKGFRFSNTSMENDQARMAAQGIIDYGNAIAASVQKLRMRGCAATQINFGNDVHTTAANPTAPPDKHCDVFRAAGGQITYAPIPEQALLLPPAHAGNTTYRHHTFQATFHIPGIGSGATELLYQINFIKPEVCVQINQILGVQNPGGNPPVTNNDPVGTHFIGVYGNPPGNTIGDEGTHDIPGKTAFCRLNGTDVYQYVQVLIAR